MKEELFLEYNGQCSHMTCHHGTAGRQLGPDGFVYGIHFPMTIEEANHIRKQCILHIQECQPFLADDTKKVNKARERVWSSMVTNICVPAEDRSGARFAYIP